MTLAPLDVPEDVRGGGFHLTCKTPGVWPHWTCTSWGGRGGPAERNASAELGHMDSWAAGQLDSGVVSIIWGIKTKTDQQSNSVLNHTNTLRYKTHILSFIGSKRGIIMQVIHPIQTVYVYVHTFIYYKLTCVCSNIAVWNSDCLREPPIASDMPPFVHGRTPVAVAQPESERTQSAAPPQLFARLRKNAILITFSHRPLSGQLAQSQERQQRPFGDFISPCHF